MDKPYIVVFQVYTQRELFTGYLTTCPRVGERIVIDNVTYTVRFVTHDLAKNLIELGV